MTKKDQKLHDQLLATAKDKSFAAAEAMGRRDAKEWQRLQDEAEKLRQQAQAIAAGGNQITPE